MKTVTGRIVSTKPVTLSKAANILSNFVSSNNGASQPVTAYLRRASAAFDELVYFKKHHRLKKNSSKAEASTKYDTSHRSLEEYEVRIEESGSANKKFGQDPVEVDENRTREVEGKSRKKEKKKKKTKGSLGSGENDNIEVEIKEDNEMMNEKNEEKKRKMKRKNAEADRSEIGNSATPERKKRRKTKADD
ncbi:hypothetical protein R6Q59_008163 [Mikania micrantha]|uniref:Uncharacterized protein n=1 Tax=Mikania micrantha TaxID=192012 RepID=A0A5N6Q5P7_9ASTR|nr:hypothetical protein E3N88_02427 [Mikania micrantha]